MSRNARVLTCTPEEVFRVLANGWLFPSWVVGASRMRAVDDTWPREESRLHHSFGVWPTLINDETVVERCDPPHLLVLRAKGWPIGESRVEIEVIPRGEHSRVRMREDAIAGPGRFIPAPLLHLGLRIRNRETLRRLAFLAEGMSQRPGTAARNDIVPPAEAGGTMSDQLRVTPE